MAARMADDDDFDDEIEAALSPLSAAAEQDEAPGGAQVDAAQDEDVDAGHLSSSAKQVFEAQTLSAISFRKHFGRVHAWLPFLATFVITLMLRLIFVLGSDPTAELVASFAGSQVAIRCDANGRYLEVSPDGWVFASAFTHNKLAARFDVEPVSPDLLRSLVRTREFRERVGGVGVRHWDMRPPRAGGAWDEYVGSSSPADPSGRGADTLDPYLIEEEQLLRRRLERAAADGERGWVLLRSPFAGGYVEVVGRGEEEEYVVRVAAEGKLSYRSLFMLEPEAVWSYAVSGALNWRPPDVSDTKQHVRAHGNTKPYSPLRAPAPTARLLVFRPPAVVDVLSGLACPTDVPPFDWKLLLDAARAGSCNSAALSTLRTAAAALQMLEESLGAAFGVELADLASAYRAVLLDEEWLEVLDLQLRRCSVEGLSPDDDDPSSPFSRLDVASGELVVDGTRCPNAAYSEVVLRSTPDEPMALEMRRLDWAVARSPSPPLSGTLNVSAPSGSDGGDNDAGAVPASSERPQLRVPLLTDAVFVLCDHDANDGYHSSESYEPGEGVEPSDDMETSTEEGLDELVPPPAPSPPLSLPNLWFRVAPELEMYRRTPRRGAKRARASSTASAAANSSADADAAAPEVADAAEAAEAADRKAYSSQLSVLLLMLDATSRAHLHRMVPKSLALLRALASSGAATLYEFPFYSIVGFNSVPNMVPMLTGVDAETLINLPPVGSYASHLYEGYESSWAGDETPADPTAGSGGRNDGGSNSGGSGTDGPKGVWDAFERHGYATFLLEELHDGCSDLTSGTPSSASKLFYSRFGAAGMPHHNVWQIFCQPELRPCCNDPESFLQPGRRQCVGGAELPELMLRYVKQLTRLYSTAGTPRMGLINLMSAHEHFMTRLGALDEPLRTFLLSIEARLRSDTAMFLLSDHGTHGIWYNHFAVGQAEHRAPALLLLLPAGFAQAHPAADAALRRNQRRRVTAYDLHATLRHLADWPTMPRPAEEASSLFTDLPDERTCEAARVPAEWCLETPQEHCHVRFEQRPARWG